MTVKPTVRGDYNIWVRWCFSAMPLYRSFNGTDWVRGGEHGGVEVINYTDDDEVFWIDYPYPYGSENPEVLLPEDLPLKMDLMSRLERFKKDKTT